MLPLTVLVIGLAVPVSPPSTPAPPQLVIDAPQTLASVAARVRGFDRTRLANIMRLTGLQDARPPIHVVLVDEGSPVARSMPNWIAGFAASADDVVVLFPARPPSYPDDSLEAVLHHEVAHVLIWRAAGGRFLPRWFSEGLAMACEHTWGLEDDARLAALQGLWSERASFDQLDALFSQGQGGNERAYALSGAFVRELLEQYGTPAATRILAAVKGGSLFSEAFEQTTGLSFAAAPQAFWTRRSHWKQWVLLLSSSALLWMGVTVLALYVASKRRRRSVELRRRWEEEEYDR
jgi:hypothetical protein